MTYLSRHLRPSVRIMLAAWSRLGVAYMPGARRRAARKQIARMEAPTRPE